MIKNPEKTAQYISDWIKARAEDAHAKSLIVGISGGVDSALVAALCKRTGMPVIGVMMPCHSSPESLTRSEEVILKFELAHHYVDLKDAFASIADQVDLGVGSELFERIHHNDCLGALRSCLRAPTLDFVGKIYNGIIVGTGNRDEDEVTRYYAKRGDGCVDINPIAKLHKSEVYELSRYLGVPQSILNATPSADLWGPDAGQTDEGQLGMTYQEIEWGIRVADNFRGCDDSNVVHKYHFDRALENEAIPKTERQCFVLKTLGNMELASRHKENLNLPICNIRLTDLVT